MDMTKSAIIAHLLQFCSKNSGKWGLEKFSAKYQI